VYCMAYQKTMQVNKVQFLYDTRWRGLKFVLAQGHLLGYLVNRFQWYYYPRFAHVRKKFPLHVDVEAANICQMNCPMCYTVSDQFKKNIERKVMDWDLFVKIINQCAEANVFSIRLSWRGEPLMHPRILDMLKYAKDKGIRNVSFITNGLLLDGDIAEKLIDYGLDYLNVSMDGVEEIYNEVWHPSNWDEALARLHKFQELKRKKGSKTPAIRVCSIWPAISQDPEGYYNTVAPLADKVVVNGYLDFEHPRDVDPNYVCQYPWQRLNITVSGTVTACPGDYFEKNPVGDANKERLIEIWHGEKINRLREKQATRKRTDIKACRECHYGWVKTSLLDMRRWDPDIGFVE